MKSFLIQISSFKVSMTLMAVALLALSQTSLEAVIIVDNDPDNYDVYHDNTDPDSNNQAYFAYYDRKKSGDDNVSGTFLETTSSGSNVEVSAYNDGDGMANTPDNNRYTTLGEPLTLADAGITTYAGTRVVAFYLDANQSGKDDGVLGNNYYDVTKLQIYFSQSKTVEAPNGGTKATLAYSFTATEGANALRLFYGNGAANWDIALYVPATQFETFKDHTPVVDLSNTYIQFHVEYTDTAGADTWGYDRGADVIPEPSSALLVSLGGLITLFRRRR